MSKQDEHWLRTPERGSALGMRALLLAYRFFGRAFARMLVGIVAFYYAAFARQARRSSTEYLRRMFGHSNFRMNALHIRQFADCALDRVLFAVGRIDDFEITRNGQHYLSDLARSKRGALLLGAHVGSFEAMRAMSQAEQLPISVLVHFRNARQINALLRALAPDFDARIIEINPDKPHWVLEVADRVGQGELVAMLGDRVGIGERTTTVQFLGALARFPVGPYMLAAALKCPVYLTFGLYHPPRGYSLYCEPFSDTITLPRGDREHALQRMAQRYADRMEFYLRHAPYNWFNFYRFWD